MHIKLKIKKLDNQGRGISYYNNKIVFVNGALDDEEVEVEIINESKKYYEANVINIIKPSNKRVATKCIHINECGGCSLMHLVISEQNIYKKKLIEEILKKYCDIDYDIKFIESNKDLFYRNKVTLKIHNNTYSYYNSKSHDYADISKCLLANNTLNEIIDYHSFMNIKDGEIVIRSNYKDELLISITTSKFEFFNDPPENVIGVVVNDKVVYGNDYFFDMIGDYKFKVSYDSFFQINNYIANEIFKILNNNLKGNTLLDLYCGSGVMGISLKDNFNKIIGIEIVEHAIKDANDNAVLNKVNNYKYYVGNTDDVINRIDEEIDTIVVDPPRSGLNDKTMDAILKINPCSIAYVSCNPITLARDLNKLKDNYKIIKIYGLDMFPNTYHCESVCILERK